MLTARAKPFQARPVLFLATEPGFSPRTRADSRGGIQTRASVGITFRISNRRVIIGAPASSPNWPTALWCGWIFQNEHQPWTGAVAVAEGEGLWEGLNSGCQPQ